MPSPVDNLVSEAEARATQVGRGYNIIEEAIQVVSEAATGAITVGEESGAVEAAVAAGAALGGAALLFVFAILLAILLLCRQIQHGLIYSYGGIGFGIGSKVTAGINAAFHPVDQLHDYLISLAEKTIHNTIAGWIHFIGWCVRQDGFGEHTNIGAQIQHFVDPVHTEVDHLWSWVNGINKEVELLRHLVYTPSNIEIRIPDAVMEQLHSLQSKFDQHEKQIAGMEHAVFNLAESVSILTNEFNALSGKVHGARAVSSGWQDIEHELEQLKTSVEQQIATLEPEVHKNTRDIAGFAELGILLEPGLRGIMNLRRLEDNPCQCPSLPHIPNLLGTALAVYEFIENG